MKGFVQLIAMLCLLGSSFCLQAVAPETIRKLNAMFPPSQKKPVRIQNLWPETYVMKLPIEPAVPENFVLKEEEGQETSGMGYFFWGPKEVLDGIHGLDVSSVTQPILVFRFTFGTTQTGSTTFSGMDELESGLEKLGFKNGSKKIFSWGPCPILTYTGNREGQPFTGAWIGLNYNSLVLFARLLYPTSQKSPSKSDLELWNRFINETRVLPETEFLNVFGLDMQDGYTVLERFGAAMTCVAERRKRDNAVQIVVVPTVQNLTFSFHKVLQERSRMSKRGGDELIKIHGEASLKYEEGGSSEIKDVVISIYIKSVEEFSLDTTQLKLDPDIFVYEGKMRPL